MLYKHAYHRDAVVTYKHVTYKLPKATLARMVLVVGDLLVVQVSWNVVELFVRCIMWWDELAVVVTITILIMIPLFVCLIGWRFRRHSVF